MNGFGHLKIWLEAIIIFFHQLPSAKQNISFCSPWKTEKWLRVTFIALFSASSFKLDDIIGEYIFGVFCQQPHKIDIRFDHEIQKFER